MKLLKYKEVLSHSKEKVEEAKVPYRVKEMKKHAELKQLEIESDIATQEQRIHTKCSAYPMDFENLVQAIDNLELLKRRLEQYNAIISQMFADDAPAKKAEKAA